MDELRERVTAIVARFLRRDPRTLDDGTPIDRASAGSSLVVFRLFATLASETGLPPLDPATVPDLGALLRAYGSGPAAPPRPAAASAEQPRSNGVAAPPEIGIDVQVLEALPLALDDPFYREQFGPRERAYCEAQAEPRRAYCGRFAGKEALLKCGAAAPSTSLATIEIVDDEQGRPVYPGASVSISHAPLFAVAVAVRVR